MPIVPLVFGDARGGAGALRRRAASRASSPRRSARRPSRDGTSRLRLVATAAHDPDDLQRRHRLYENIMNESGYSACEGK